MKWNPAKEYDGNLPGSNFKFGGDPENDLGAAHQVLGSTSCKPVDKVPGLGIKSTYADL